MSAARTALADAESTGAHAAPDALRLRELRVPGDPHEGTPRVILLDASSLPRSAAQAGQDAALRMRARSLSGGAGSPHCSRSYRAPLALLAFHDAPVGVDVERVSRCDDAFAESIQTPAERSVPLPPARDRFLSSLWSSKEALSKALGDPLAYDPRRLEGPGAWPAGRSGPWRAAPPRAGRRLRRLGLLARALSQAACAAGMFPTPSCTPCGSTITGDVAIRITRSPAALVVTLPSRAAT